MDPASHDFETRTEHLSREPLHQQGHRRTRRHAICPKTPEYLLCQENLFFFSFHVVFVAAFKELDLVYFPSAASLYRSFINNLCPFAI